MATTTSAYEMDGVGVSAVNNAANQISQLKGIAQANSAFNAEQAQLQREWTEQQNAKAMQFNRIEAKKNRDWQEMMSYPHESMIQKEKDAAHNHQLGARHPDSGHKRFASHQ